MQHVWTFASYSPDCPPRSADDIALAVNRAFTSSEAARRYVEQESLKDEVVDDVSEVMWTKVPGNSETGDWFQWRSPSHDVVLVYSLPLEAA